VANKWRIYVAIAFASWVDGENSSNFAHMTLATPICWQPPSFAPFFVIPASFAPANGQIISFSAFSTKAFTRTKGFLVIWL